jgi:hypothetical protein
MNVTITTIPHSQQRYETVGDWQFDEFSNLSIKVSGTSDWRMTMAVGVHELVEALLCKDRGISEAEVDEFDMAYKGDGEPGNDPSCPYYDEHQVATIIERLLIRELGLNWQDYDRVIDAL